MQTISFSQLYSLAPVSNSANQAPDNSVVHSTTAVESLLITAAELHIRADLGVVDAAEKTLTTDPAAAVTGQSAPSLTPPQTAAG
jgi:hypothetical protein